VFCALLPKKDFERYTRWVLRLPVRHDIGLSASPRDAYFHVRLPPTGAVPGVNVAPQLTGGHTLCGTAHDARHEAK
jgi:hypothetical protein